MTKTTVIDEELLRAIHRAGERVYRLADRTPLLESRELAQHYGAGRLFLKFEDLQHRVNAFKIRGVTNFYYARAPMPQALVTASGGSHALAVAHLACTEHVPATIFVSQAVSVRRVARIKRLGGHWVDVRQPADAQTFAQAQQLALDYSDQTGAVMVPPYDDLYVIAGQGTIGLEVADRLTAIGVTPDVTICQVGGGGLIAGYGTAIKSVFGAIRLIGAEMREATAMTESLAAGARQHITVPLRPLAPTLAVSQVGELTFGYAQGLVDDMAVVSAPAVARAKEQLGRWFSGHAFELAAAVGLGALEQLSAEVAGKTVVCLLTGGNFDRSDWAMVHDLARECG